MLSDELMSGLISSRTCAGVLAACMVCGPATAWGQTQPPSAPTTSPEAAPQAPSAPVPAPVYGTPHSPPPGQGVPYGPAPGYGSYGSPYTPASGYPAPHPAAPYSAAPYPAAPVDPRPKYLPYREGEPPPPGYVFDEEMRRGPLIGGLITLGVPYLIGLLVASQENYSNKKGYLLIPAVGPWLTLLARDSSCDPTLPISDCVEDSASRFALVLSGILQTGGAVITASGIFNTRKRYMLKLEEGPPPSTPTVMPPQVSVLPRAMRQGFGFDVVGRF